MAVTDLDRVVAPWPGLRSKAQPRERVGLAVLSRLHARELDRQLAGGAAPHSNHLLAARARRLVTVRSRRRVAGGLKRLMNSGDHGFTAAIPPDRREVLAARVVIVVLDRRLRSAEPVDPRGIALLQTLLTDGASALYLPGAPGALGSQLRAAAAALEPAGRLTRSARVARVA